MYSVARDCDNGKIDRKVFPYTQVFVYVVHHAVILLHKFYVLNVHSNSKSICFGGMFHMHLFASFFYDHMNCIIIPFMSGAY